MNGKKLKNSRKTKEQKNILAKKNRKERKKQKTAKNFAQKTLNAKKQRSILFLIMKKNFLPALALTSGCFIFYFSNFHDSIPSSYLIISQQEKTTGVTIARFDNLPEDRSLSQNEKTEAENKNLQPDKSEKNAEITITPLPEKTQKKTYPVRYADNDPYADTEALRAAIAKIIKDTPMEAMLDEIVARDRAVAAFLIGIGMKESKYGIYSPKKEGAECFNYWGYRGRENRTKSGYSCFDSPEHAVQVVGDRIEAFVRRGLDTPAKIIVWKCGYSCEGHSEESVDKWIADVSIHYYRLNPVLRELVVR